MTRHVLAALACANLLLIAGPGGVALAQPAAGPVLGAPAQAKVAAPPAAPTVKAGAGGGPTAAPELPGALPPRPAVITGPQWLERPTADDLMKAYPARALALGQEGSVIIRCVVLDDGGLDACETPQDALDPFGFGAAALSLAPKFKMRATTPDGGPIGGGKVAVPIQFKTGLPPAR